MTTVDLSENYISGNVVEKILIQINVISNRTIFIHDSQIVEISYSNYAKRRKTLKQKYFAPQRYIFMIYTLIQIFRLIYLEILRFK